MREMEERKRMEGGGTDRGKKMRGRDVGRFIFSWVMDQTRLVSSDKLLI